MNDGYSVVLFSAGFFLINTWGRFCNVIFAGYATAPFALGCKPG
jgi:hypothetical protein